MENAKNNRQMAMNALPMEPNEVENASCVSAAPVCPEDSEPVETMTSAVMVTTINVSMNTPIMASTP